MRFFLILLFAAVPLGKASLERPSFVFWQVNKGEWLTWASQNRCDHFSLGGRNFDLKPVRKLCEGKSQRLWLPTLKLEHRAQLSKYQRFEKVCVAAAPKTKRKIDLGPLCESEPALGVQILKSKDGESLVFVIEEFELLILGDMIPREEELRKLRKLKLRNLVLAHHGRKRGLSRSLLQNLPGLQRVFVSDLVYSRTRRKQSRVDDQAKRLLIDSNIPPLATSQWGHIHYFAK